MQSHNVDNDLRERKRFHAITAGATMLASGFFTSAAVAQLDQDPAPGLFVGAVFFLFSLATGYQMSNDNKDHALALNSIESNPQNH